MKSLLFLPLLLLGVFFTSCKKEEITQEIVPNRTINFTVQSGAWVKDDNRLSHYAELPVPELTDHVNQTNGVLVYISDDGQTWEAIPDVLNGITFLYTYTVGKIYLEAQDVNGTQLASPPGGTIYVKVVLVESEPV